MIPALAPGWARQNGRYLRNFSRRIPSFNLDAALASLRNIRQWRYGTPQNKVGLDAYTLHLANRNASAERFPQVRTPTLDLDANQPLRAQNQDKVCLVHTVGNSECLVTAEAHIRRPKSARQFSEFADPMIVRGVVVVPKMLAETCVRFTSQRFGNIERFSVYLYACRHEGILLGVLRWCEEELEDPTIFAPLGVLP
jgi:hypothetical protein